MAKRRLLKQKQASTRWTLHIFRDRRSTKYFLDPGFLTVARNALIDHSANRVTRVFFLHHYITQKTFHTCRGGYQQE